MRKPYYKAAWAMAALFLGVTLAAPPAARAELSARDLQVATRSLAFLIGRDISALKVAILYAPEIEASRKEAEDLAAKLGTGFNAGRVTLVPVPPVTLMVKDLPQLEGKDAVFVTGGLKAWYAAIADVSRDRHIVTITSDFDCVSGGFCLMGVHTDPRVEVLINHNLAVQSGIEFAPGFRLLVTEL